MQITNFSPPWIKIISVIVLLNLQQLNFASCRGRKGKGEKDCIKWKGILSPKETTSSIITNIQLQTMLGTKWGIFVHLVFGWILKSPKVYQFCTPLTGCLTSVFSNIFSLTAFLQASFSSLSSFAVNNFLHLNPFFLFHFILLMHFFQTGYNMIVALQSHSHPTIDIRMVCDLSFPAPQAMTDG